MERRGPQLVGLTRMFVSGVEILSYHIPSGPTPALPVQAAGAQRPAPAQAVGRGAEGPHPGPAIQRSGLPDTQGPFSYSPGAVTTDF